MKPLIFLFAFTVILAGCYDQDAPTVNEGINPVLGDASFKKTYGYLPGENTGETLRIYTHLTYVEKKLREQDVSHLSQEKREQRAKMLDLLQNYRLTELYPESSYHPDKRRPVFIDDNGNLCAVGYLIAETAGRETAEAINKRYRFAELQDMQMDAINEWVAESGLTKKELAMIQPAYAPPGGRDNVSAKYRGGSALFLGLGGGLTALNVIDYFGHNEVSKGKLTAGVITGTGYITLGLAAIHKGAFDKMAPDYNYQQTSRLAAANIAAGSFMVAINGLMRQQFKDSEDNSSHSPSLSMFSLPDAEHGMLTGLTLRHRF